LAIEPTGPSEYAFTIGIEKKLIIKKASDTTNNVIREKQGPYTLIGSKMLLFP